MDVLQTSSSPAPRREALTLLVPAETNVKPTNDGSTRGTIEPDLTGDVSFRHSGWRSRRAKIDRALIESGASMSRMESFRSCGQNAWVYEDPANPGTYSIKCDLCKDRMCTPCQTARSNIIRRNLMPLIKGGITRFITLTLKSRPGSLREQMNRLVKCFRALRNRAIWKECVSAAASVIEITYNPDTKCFHPHIHILCRGKYLPKPLLVNLWKQITGDSFIVDIQMIRDEKKAAGYLAKYVTKPISAELLDNQEALAEAIDALAGRRLVTTMGNWRGIKLLEASDSPDWRPVCTLRALRERASTGDADAIVIATSLLEQMSWQNQMDAPDHVAPGP